ncbi:MAG: hypothetical protein ACE5HA_08785 [Anaerolineae bacterium]
MSGDGEVVEVMGVEARGEFLRACREGAKAGLVAREMGVPWSVVRRTLSLVPEFRQAYSEIRWSVSERNDARLALKRGLAARLEAEGGLWEKVLGMIDSADLESPAGRKELLECARLFLKGGVYPSEAVVKTKVERRDDLGRKSLEELMALDGKLEGEIQDLLIQRQQASDADFEPLKEDDGRQQGGKTGTGGTDPLEDPLA